ncbi:uncharacterized protein JCM10292_003318 [Rhodotorula paludigena]|uniref:uncharacterized protein n=1 Tax=Rhodotorula paludigena TaxID=86838 RepID=UPI00317D2B25
MANAPAEAPWHAAFPTPRATVVGGDIPSLTADELQAKLEAEPELEKRSFVVVDVRRTDFEDGFISGAINLPAHSLYPTLPGLLPMLSRHALVIFHCNSCSAGGRGHRSAGWYQDALDQAGVGKDVSRAAVLEGGIKGWLKGASEGGKREKLTVKL